MKKAKLMKLPQMHWQRRWSLQMWARAAAFRACKTKTQQHKQRAKDYEPSLPLRVGEGKRYVQLLVIKKREQGGEKHQSNAASYWRHTAKAQQVFSQTEPWISQFWSHNFLKQMLSFSGGFYRFMWTWCNCTDNCVTARKPKLQQLFKPFFPHVLLLQTEKKHRYNST